MLELKQNALVFTFPEVHPDARLVVEFMRTLRIPDDDKTYPLPPGLGRFEMRHVDDLADRVPALWTRHGGVALPMYPAEAMWLNFRSNFLAHHRSSYPFALKIAAGKRSAVTGDPWHEGLQRPGGLLRRPKQDYVVVPVQPWLDGFVVSKGLIRQFVAMELGRGYSVEEQLTGEAEHGGLQIEVVPMKREAFERHHPWRELPKPRAKGMRGTGGAPPMPAAPAAQAMRSSAAPDMGLAAGGRMKQTIHTDPYALDDWQIDTRSRCFVHLANALVWQAITGSPPPQPPPTAADYTRAGLPWFDHYSPVPAVDADAKLASIRSVLDIATDRGEVALPENESTTPQRIVPTTPPSPDAVRDGEF